MRDPDKPPPEGKPKPPRPTLLEQDDQREAEEFAKRCEEQLSKND